MRKLALAISLSILAAAPCLAQSNITAGTPPKPVTTTNPFPVSVTATSGTAAVNITQVGGATQSATNPLFVEPTDGTAAAITGNHPIATRQSADGTNFVDATHGLYSNLLQGNAVVSTTNPVPVSPNGVAQASIVNVTAAVANVDTTIAFGASFTHAIIKTDTGAAAIYVDLANGTATTADFKIDGGGALTYTGAPITGFHYIGATATGNISYLAW